MIVFPNAKINIGLNITRKREDGFHDIETIFYPVGLSDVLELVGQEEPLKIKVHTTGLEIPGSKETNLCVKAYELIARDYYLPGLKVHLHKLIPIGAGLGGGSSDAAFFIKAIDQFFSLNLSWGEKHHYAKLLGSDCSFFITNKVSFATEKGENLETINLSLKGYSVIIVKPPIHINTAEAYSGVIPKPSFFSLDRITETPIQEWSSFVKNDFEPSIFAKYPVIKNIKETLYNKGAVYAAMSGSGSAVYGIFENTPQIPDFTDFFVWKGKLE